MTVERQCPKPGDRRRGAVLVIVALLMVVLLGFVALAVDLGYMFVTRNELQNAADASALAGTRLLGHMYQQMTAEEQQTFNCDAADCIPEIRDTAQAVAGNNRAAGVDVVLIGEEIRIGQWDGDAFTETSYLPDAVEVTARRDETVEETGPVATFFARALGIENASVSAVATAALTGQGTANEGELELPIGIARAHFDAQPDGGYCKTDIQFSPTNDPSSCGGWHSFVYTPSNDNLLRDIALGEDPEYASPFTVAGDTEFSFTGGNLSTHTFDNLLTRFQREGWDVDQHGNYLLDGESRIHQATVLQGAVPLSELDEDGNPLLDKDGNEIRALYPDGTPRNLHKWETTLPVYDWGDCSNPNTTILIVGFAQIEMTDVFGPPSKLVRGTVMCDLVDLDDTRGGGGEYGIKGSIPGLVK